MHPKMKVATDCFMQNRQLVAPSPDVNIEKWNLYNGLAMLAEAVGSGNTAAARTATKCFGENFQGCDPAADTEKWNLYNGLSNLADAVAGG
jgi:hypothetical protein